MALADFRDLIIGLYLEAKMDQLQKELDGFCSNEIDVMSVENVFCTCDNPVFTYLAADPEWDHCFVCEKRIDGTHHKDVGKEQRREAMPESKKETWRDRKPLL